MNRRKLHRKLRTLERRVASLEERLNGSAWTDMPPGIQVDMDPDPGIAAAVAPPPLIVPAWDDEEDRRGYL